MAELNRSQLMMYLACAGCTIAGLAMAFGVGDEEASADDDAPTTTKVEFDRAPHGVQYDPATGVTDFAGAKQQGSEAKSQVKLLPNPHSKPLRPPKPSTTDPLFEAQREMRGGDTQLREVLEQMGGEPVWVEGLDGPVPEKKKKP